MKLYGLLIAAQNRIDSQVYIYSREYDLSSFGYFTKNSVKDSFKFLCRESLLKLEKGTRYTITHETQYVVHILGSTKGNIAAYAFCDMEYSKRIAFQCLAEFVDLFHNKIGDDYNKFQEDENLDCDLPKLFEKYMNPAKIDNIISAQTKANQVKEVLHDNIRKLLERGEKLEELVAKSKDLSTQSKQFMKTTTKLGSGKWCFCFK